VWFACHARRPAPTGACGQTADRRPHAPCVAPLPCAHLSLCSEAPTPQKEAGLPRPAGGTRESTSTPQTNKSTATHKPCTWGEHARSHVATVELKLWAGRNQQVQRGSSTHEDLPRRPVRVLWLTCCAEWSYPASSGAGGGTKAPTKFTAACSRGRERGRSSSMAPSYVERLGPRFAVLRPLEG